MPKHLQYIHIHCVKATRAHTLQVYICTSGAIQPYVPVRAVAAVVRFNSLVLPKSPIYEERVITSIIIQAEEICYTFAIQSFVSSTAKL